MRKPLLYLLLTLLVACAACVVLQTYRLQKRCAACTALQLKVADLEAATGRLREHFEQQVASHAAECRRLRTELAAWQARGGPVEGAAPPPDNGVGQAAINYMSGLMRLMDTPDVRDQTRQRIEREHVVAAYAEFLNDLMLPPEEISKVRALLVDRMMAAWGPNLELLDPQSSLEQRAAARAYTTNVQAHIDARIEEIIGAEAAADFRTYVATERERTIVTHVNQQLASDPRHLLTSPQRATLVTIMHDEWSGLESRPDYVDLSYAGPSEVTPESTAQYYTQQTGVLARITARAQSCLSEYQYGALTSFFRQVVQDLQTRIGLTLAMSDAIEGDKEE